ncbi:DUF6615 family protein [Nocardia salmonicida]|uniref:DUF6615 family protein n=1 Tax=Nocardia salmonicida TaxID=53431 RepID=UPI00371524F0
MATHSDLTAAMDYLAVDTWRRLEHGQPRGLAPSEESITDHVLFELNQQFPQILVHKPSKQEEARLGADWEWWIGSDTRWLCLRVQAKKFFGHHYRYLGHRPRGADDRQIDLLIEGCKQRGHLPYHVFYNGWGSDHFGGKDLAALHTNRRYFPHTPWQPMVMRNPTHPEGYEEVALGEKNPRWWGCSALPSRIVVGLMRNSPPHYVPRYLEHAMPWSMIFSTTRASRARDAVPKTFVDAVDVIHWRLLRGPFTDRGMLRMFSPNASERANPSVLDEWRLTTLPSYVRAVLDGGHDLTAASLTDMFDGQLPVRRLVFTDLADFPSNGAG